MSISSNEGLFSNNYYSKMFKNQEELDSFLRRNSGQVIYPNGEVKGLSDVLLEEMKMSHRGMTPNQFIDYFYDLVEEDSFIENIQKYQNDIKHAVDIGIFDMENYKKLVNKKVYKLLNNEYIVYNMNEDKFVKLCLNNMFVALSSEECIERMNDMFFLFLYHKYSEKVEIIKLPQFTFDCLTKIIDKSNGINNPAYHYKVNIVLNCLHFNNYNNKYVDLFKPSMNIELSEYDETLKYNKQEFEYFLLSSLTDFKFVDSISDKFATILFTRLTSGEANSKGYEENYHEFSYIRERLEAIKLLKGSDLIDD